MPQKSKVGRGSRKTRTKTPKDKAQSARFIKTARTLGVDESGRPFMEALHKIMPEEKKQK